MWHILSTIFMTSSPLCMRSQPCVWITPHSAYVWHNLHYRIHHIHSITPSHNLYDFTSTSGMTSHPLYQTSHQLYLCHHNLSNDITPTFVWHHTHYICDIIRTIYNIISTSYVIPIFYLGQHNLDIWNHIQNAVQNIHYPCDITVTSLCHHTQCIESITPTLCMTSHSAQVKHLMHYRRHYILTLWNQSTIFMTSHPLYSTLYRCYFCHHIHSVDDITPNLFMRSRPLYMSTSYSLYTTTYSLYFSITATIPVSHTHSFHDITPFVYMTLHTLYVYHQILYIMYHIHHLWHHSTLFMTSNALYSCYHSHDIYPQYLCPDNPTTYDLWTTVCMTSHPLYIWHIKHHT